MSTRVVGQDEMTGLRRFAALSQVPADAFHGSAFLGRGGIDALDALIDGGVCDVRQLNLAEQAVRAIVFHDTCYPLDVHLGDSVVLQSKLVDDAWDCLGLTLDVPLGQPILAEAGRANDRLTDYLRTVRHPGAIVLAADLDTGAGVQASLETAWYRKNSAPLSEMLRKSQAVGDSIAWGTRFSVAYVGGASLLGIEPTRSKFVDAFDQRTDFAWQLQNQLPSNTSSARPAIQLPTLLYPVLLRAGHRDRIPDAILEVKAELAEGVAHFQSLLCRRDFLAPRDEGEAREVTKEINEITAEFFTLMSSPPSPSWIRKFGPGIFRFGAYGFHWLFDQPAVPVAAAVYELAIKLLEQTDWATRSWNPSLADRLCGLDLPSMRDSAQIEALLAKLLSPVEHQLLGKSIRDGALSSSTR